jgi:hypothetical protein
MSRIFRQISLLALVMMTLSVVFTASETRAQQAFFKSFTAEDNQSVMTDEFYQSCIENPVFVLSPEAMEELCTCADIRSRIVAEQQLGAMSSDILDPVRSDIEIDDKTLILDIYGHCLFVPARENSYMDCMADDRTPFFFPKAGTQIAYCQCVALGEEDYFAMMAEPYLRYQWDIRNGEIVDPIALVRWSTNYILENRKFTAACRDQFHQ